MTRILAGGNRKGGIGKSTTTATIGAELALMGYRVLMIDMDGQLTLSEMLGVQDETPNIEDVLQKRGATPITEAIRPSTWDGVDVIPGSSGISFLDFEKDGVVALRLRQRFEAAADQLSVYDFILIDLPPAVNMPQIVGVCAADQIIAYGDARGAAVRPLFEFFEQVEELKAIRPGLEVAGVVVTFHLPRSVDSREALAQIEAVAQQFGSRVIEPYVEQREAFKDVFAMRMPVRHVGRPESVEVADRVALLARRLMGMEAE